MSTFDFPLRQFQKLFGAIMSNNYENNESVIAVNPPESLVKYDAPLFVGVQTRSDGDYTKAKLTENQSKLDDMLNSMLPPKYIT